MTIAQRFKPGTTTIRLPSPRRDDRSRQLRRSGMFIAREPNQDPRKPQRGGMVARGGRHAAPTELEEIRGGAVSINMPLLRSLALADACRNWSPNRLNPARSGHTQQRNRVSGHKRP